MTKKLVSMLMVAVLAVGCLSGCGSKESQGKSETKTTETQQTTTSETSQIPVVEEIPNFNPEGYPIVDDPITLNVMWCIADSLDLMPFEELQIIQELEATTGINLEAEIVKAADFTTKLNLLFTAGEYPDIIICSQGSVDYEEYGVNQKILIPMDELMEKYLPAYNERAASSPVDPSLALRASDGQLYTIPFVKSSGGQLSGNQFFLNYDWLDAVGMEKPATIDDLTEVLRAFKTKDPNGNGKADEIPMSLYSGVIDDVLHLFGLPASGSNYMWINDDKKVEFIPTTDAYRECLEWLHELYKEELLDVEVFSQDKSTFNAKLNALQVGAFPAYRLNSSGFETTIDVCDLWYTEETKYGWSLPVSSNDSAYITVTNKYPEASMRLFNYMLEWGTQEDFYLGPQGHPEDGWDYNAEGLIDDYNYRTGDAKNVDSVRFSNSALCFVPPHLLAEKFVLGASVLERLDYQDEFTANDNIIKYSWHYLNLVKYDSETKEKISLIRADMGSAITEYRTNFIREGVTDDSWAAYCKLFKDMNVDYILQVYQDAIDQMDIAPNEF